MFKVKIVFSLVLLSFSLDCFSFNWQKCKKSIRPDYDFLGFAHGFAILSSTTQWTSSTGSCAMIGDHVNEKKLFVAQNLESLKIDSARGSGEYLSAYLSLSGCSRDNLTSTIPVIQRNFIKIYGENLQNSPEQTYGQFENIFNTDPVIKTSCKRKG